MTDLYSLFHANCQVLIRGGGGEVVHANNWFLAFCMEQPLLCWTFSAEVISQAHHRLEAEVSEEQRRRGLSVAMLMASSHLHESFFAIKMLQNVMLAPVQWVEVPEELRMQTKQVSRWVGSLEKASLVFCLFFTAHSYVSHSNSCYNHLTRVSHCIT